MDNELAIALLEALKNGLHETGKDFPYRDEIIPLFKEALDMAIKTLEQEPCVDAISRAEAMSHPFANGKYDHKNANEDFILGFESYKEWLETLPSVYPKAKEQKWIPVSERLPEENGWYQCIVILNDLPLVMELFYKNDKWLDNRRINMFDTYDIYGYGNTEEKHKLSYQELISEFEWTENVISWMPLPEPYKAESEDNMNQYEIDYKQGYDNANDEWLEKIDKIKRDIFNACSDSYHMPVYKLNCDEIFEIIDKYNPKENIAEQNKIEGGYKEYGEI